ncbi:MAG: UDP-N-acetylmuramate--L-alanine ligase [bacterium]|nr:UDP-N-acetylmuramate--L-alanine ligase [bacterium]
MLAAGKGQPLTMPACGLGRVHLIGIGGSGMSAIATLLIQMGCRVSGSDLRASDATRKLESLGVRFYHGHRPENLGRPDLVVISTAVADDNPELQAARQRGFRVLRRIEMLDLALRGKRTIAVSGSHGKTTTTSLLYRILRAARLDPTVVVGGTQPELGSNAELGKGDLAVVEADESDGSFLKLSPEIALATNVDDDHLNYYGSFEGLVESFRRYLEGPGPAGLAVLCADDEHLAALAPRLSTPRITYGLRATADYTACHLSLEPRRVRFDVYHEPRFLGRVELPLPGEHNVLNALGALAVAHRLGVPFAVCREACREFPGVARRYQVWGAARGITVMDDFGHHPTEIEATLSTIAGEGYRRVVVVFQPHRYTRTERLHRDFGPPFRHADLVIVPPIFAASEAPREGVTADLIVSAIRELAGREVVPVSSLDTALEAVLQRAEPGDLVLTLGCGDVGELAPRILAALGREA